MQTSVVLELPPRDSLRKKVSLLSRKGTWFEPSVRLIIQRPKAVKLRLIFYSWINRLKDAYLGFFKDLASGSSLGDALATCKVDQVKPTGGL